MALKYNSTTIPSSGTVKFNTASLKIVKYGTTTVWQKEEERTLVSGLNLNTNQAHSGARTQEKTSDEYTIASGFNQIIVSGTVGRTINNQGTYPGSTSIQIQGYNGSTWQTLKEYSTTSTDTNKNGDWSYSAAATITGASSYTKCRLYMKAVAADMGSETTIYTLWCSNVTIKIHT